MDLVQIGRHTGAVLGGRLRQRKGIGAHMYVCYDTLFPPFFPFYLQFFLFFTARSVRALIIFFCGLRSRLVLAEVFFHCPPPIFRGTGFPRVP